MAAWKSNFFFFTVWTPIRLWNTSLRRQEASYSVHARPTPPPTRSAKKGRASLGEVSPTLQTGPTFFCWGHMYLSWPQLCCVVKDNLKLLICLPPASKCLNYKWFWLTKHLTDVIWNANFLEGRGNLLLRIEPKTLYKLGKCCVTELHPQAKRMSLCAIGETGNASLK